MNNASSFEQLGATLLTGLIISGGQKGDPVKIVKRANTALAVATAVTALGDGDAAGGVAALQGILSDTNLDPGVALAVHGLFGIGAQQLALLSSLNKALPFFGASAEAVAMNIAAGITQAANAEIAKYGQQAANPK